MIVAWQCSKSTSVVRTPWAVVAVAGRWRVQGGRRSLAFPPSALPLWMLRAERHCGSGSARRTYFRRTIANHALGPPGENVPPVNSGFTSTRTGSTDSTSQPSAKVSYKSWRDSRLGPSDRAFDQAILASSTRSLYFDVERGAGGSTKCVEARSPRLAAELLASLRERTVGHERLAVAHLDTGAIGNT
jgi:hypothetical protein